MTIEEKIQQMLFERGMFEAQAAEVVAAVKADPANEAMAGRWSDSIEGYPKEIMALAWHSACCVQLTRGKASRATNANRSTVLTWVKCAHHRAVEHRNGADSEQTCPECDEGFVEIKIGEYEECKYCDGTGQV